MAAAPACGSLRRRRQAQDSRTAKKRKVQARTFKLALDSPLNAVVSPMGQEATLDVLQRCERVLKPAFEAKTRHGYGVRIGVNAVTRAMEKKELACAVVATDQVQPALLIHHFPALSQVTQTPVCLLGQGATPAALGAIFGRSSVLAFGIDRQSLFLELASALPAAVATVPWVATGNRLPVFRQPQTLAMTSTRASKTTTRTTNQP